MILERDWGYSLMSLPGPYQPKLASWWYVTGDDELQKLYLENRQGLGFLSLDAIYMGDGKKYQFGLVLSDQKNHNFY